ncbi:hypothetical protein ACFFF7_01660 [Novosphingobium aquiterrae]|uniref:DUF1795 domain-containing protein n=1 Tax=Novosphingobium aquiterrae TaxID=624388 RepID=A0ABV6PE65_9SPHN
MIKRVPIRTLRLVVSLLLVFWVLPAHAERLTFDHRLYPPLKAVLDGGDQGMIDFNGKDPRYVVDLIAIKGSSAKNWIEALEIIARSPDKKVKTARDWAAELKARTDRGCMVDVTPITEDEISLTFERHVTACPRTRAETTITRIVQGKRSLFLLTILIKGVPDQPARRQWLELLQSAHIE